MAIASQSTTLKLLMPVMHVLRTRRYQLIILVSAVIYALSYMFILGIISYLPGLDSITDTYPLVVVTSYGISIIPTSNIYFFVLYETIAFIVTSSFLVGLNISLIFYLRKVGKSCGIRSINIKGIFGIIPAFFTSFACCGGGLLILVIGSTIFSSLALYSKYMVPLTIGVLAVGTFIMSRKISKMTIQNNTGFRHRKEEH